MECMEEEVDMAAEDHIMEDLVEKEDNMAVMVDREDVMGIMVLIHLIGQISIQLEAFY